MEDYTTGKEKVLGMIKNTDINHARSIFVNIEWNSLDGMIGKRDGTCLLICSRVGLMGIEKIQRTLLNFYLQRLKKNMI